MNINRFKKLVVSKGGEILSIKKFKYKGNIYPFCYFVKDSKQWVPYFSYRYRHHYKDQITDFLVAEIINDHKQKDGPVKRFFLTIWIILSLIFHFFSIIFWFFSIAYRTLLIELKFLEFITNLIPSILFHWKNQYSDLDMRIKELNHWSQAYYKLFGIHEENMKDNHLSFAFNKLMLNDYAKRKKKKYVPSFKNQMAMKKYLENEKLEEEKKKRKKRENK